MKESHLWRNLSEKEKEQIKEDSKKIISNFYDQLKKIDDSQEEFSIDRPNCERVEGDGNYCDEDFRRLMFENASNKNEDFILGEKKKW